MYVGSPPLIEEVDIIMGSGFIQNSGSRSSFYEKKIYIYVCPIYFSINFMGLTPPAFRNYVFFFSKKLLKYETFFSFCIVRTFLLLILSPTRYFSYV